MVVEGLLGTRSPIGEAHTVEWNGPTPSSSKRLFSLYLAARNLGVGKRIL
jgi:hypothetical protein